MLSEIVPLHKQVSFKPMLSRNNLNKMNIRKLITTIYLGLHMADLKDNFIKESMYLSMG